MASLPAESQSRQQDVPLHGSSVNIVRRCGPALTALLRTRFHCEAVVSGVDLDLGPGRPTVIPVKRFESSLPSGVKVSVWRADLTNFSAAAVVNAANSKLQHFGGLALALSQAGGPEIQQESDDYVKIHGDVKTGKAVALGAGKLKCKRIIHAVGPQLSYKPNHHEVSAARPQLERAVRSVLEIVENKRLETVAIPAISSGLFNYPVAECADVIVATVKGFYGSSTSPLFMPKEVLLVNNDEPTVKEMERACCHLLSPPPGSHSQATAGRGSQPPGSHSQATAGRGSQPPGSHSQATAGRGSQTPGSHSQATTGRGSQPPVSYSQAAAGSGPQTRGAKGGTQHPQIQFGLVRVILRKGRLEEQQMDVIVNTIGSDKYLNTGQVSKSLLKKAGHKMQQEVYSAPVSGSVIITKAYGLHCKEVYHTCCPFKKQTGSEQVLFRSVQECFWLAVAAKHHSIAFPAIGTGNLGFSDREAALIMLHAAWDFAQKSPCSLEVHFVIFPTDVGRFKAFEEELKSLQPKAFQMDSPQNFPGGAPSVNSKPALLPDQQQDTNWDLSDKPQLKGATAPCISLQSSSEESTVEAKAWLQSLLFNDYGTACIFNNFIQHLGEKQLLELSRDTEGVLVEELLERGRSGFIVSGNKAEDIAVAAVKIEEMLSDVQQEFISQELQELRREGKLQFRRVQVPRKDPEIKHLHPQLKKEGLHLIKAEMVDNPVLEKLFKLQKAQMSSSSSSSSEIMLQLVPAQFCDMVSHIGFRPECAPPDDPSLGEGVYFAADLNTALRLWSHHRDHYLYVVLAEVLKGKSGPGKPGLVLPPPLGSDPTTRRDSVEGPGVSVIFNPLQARPRFILTCKSEVDSGTSL